MPKLWNETIEAHRSAVRDAVMDATAALVAEQGLLSVTMSRIAESSGVGRATLYKYFPDVESILTAWHERQVTAHIEQLTAVRDQAGGPGERLARVLGTYARLSRERHRNHGSDIATHLHRGESVARAHGQLGELVRDLVAAGVAAGEIRDDVAPDELANYCLHALDAAGSLPSDAAVHRLVHVTIAGLRPQPEPVEAPSTGAGAVPHEHTAGGGHHRPAGH